LGVVNWSQTYSSFWKDARIWLEIIMCVDSTRLSCSWPTDSLEVSPPSKNTKWNISKLKGLSLFDVQCWSFSDPTSSHCVSLKVVCCVDKKCHQVFSRVCDDIIMMWWYHLTSCCFVIVIQFIGEIQSLPSCFLLSFLKNAQSIQWLS
jgi:hypothetical protein